MVSLLQSNGIRPLCKEEPTTTSKEETSRDEENDLNPPDASPHPLSEPQASSFPSRFSVSTFNPKADFFKPIQASMGKLRGIGFVLICSGIISLGILAFISCFIAENKRSKRDDLKVDGNLCFLPASPAFGFGVAAMICLSIAQATGNLVFCADICSRRKTRRDKKKLILGAIFLIFSWANFGMATILMGSASSMSRRQSYGKGWLDGECYLVKRGVFIGAGILSLVTVSALLGAVIATAKQKQIHQSRPKNKDETS